MGDSDDTGSVSSPPVEPNRVSELYEGFRSLRTVLDAIIEYPTSAVSPDEVSQPLVQYHAVIRAVIGTAKYLPAGVEGFGGQQADRVPTEMTEYRTVYGNESWVTSYQHLETAPLAEDTQRALEAHDLVADASVFVRPVAPETGTPLPLLPWSAEELTHGLSLLSQFPARPAVPWDDEESGQFPVEAVYEQVCTVEEIDADQRVTVETDPEPLSTTPASTDMWSTAETPPTDRCGFQWPPDGQSDGTGRASCCYRETWREFDRCIWHADTDIDKPSAELADAREAEANRLHNHLPREILAGAVLRDTQLTDELLTGVDFRGAEFDGCTFTDVYLSYATFTGASLRGVDFTETTVSRVSFQNADLTGASLAGLSLYDVDFTDAILTDANLTAAKVEQATVTEAALEDAVGLETTDLDAANDDGDEASTGDRDAESADDGDAESADGRDAESADDRDAESAEDERTDTDTMEETETNTETTEETEASTTTPTVESIAASSSIMSTSDIESTLDKLQSRGATQEEALSCVSQYAHDMDHDEGLYSIPGLGPIAGYHLAAAGITSRDELAARDFETFKRIDGISEAQLERIWKAVDSADQPATDAEGTEPAVPPNELSEYYESLRTVRKIVSTVMQLEGTGIVPDDLTDPAVQYYVLLDGCLSYGLTETNFTGYGLQHQNRLATSVDDYRDAYGDPDTGQVVDYQAIAVQPYSDDTQSWLATNTWLTNTDQFVRPVAPESDHPLPEMVTTKQELVRAVELLNEFPAYPDVPTEPDRRDRTIPIKTLYRELFAEVHDEYLIDLSLLSAPGQANGEPITGPVAEATPTSQADAESMLLDYGKLSHLFRRVAPPSESPIRRQLPVFGLDWYQQRSPSFNDLQNLAKYGDADPISNFKPRLQDMIHRRFLRDRWNYDYITVFPGHEQGSLSAPLVDLAQEAVVETSMVYTPLLERTETSGRQREKSEAGRKEVAIDPEETLRVRASLDGESVVILDDICTTGSSLLAGSYLLREAGASRIVGVTLGFTPGGPVDDVSVIEAPDAYASEIIAGVE